MSYTPFYSQWKDWPDISTPTTAAAMQHIEAGIAAASGTSAGDLTFDSDNTASGTGDIIFQTSNVERLRISASTGQMTSSETMTNPPVSNTIQITSSTLTGRGTGTISERGLVFTATAQDGSVANYAVSNATNNGGLIRLTIATHTLSTGDRVGVYGVGGVTNANGGWTVTVINNTTVDLQGSTFSGSYTSGGTLTNRPSMICFRAAVSPAADRGGLDGTLANDDLACFTAEIDTPHKGTDAFYVAKGVSGSSWGSGISIDANCDVGVRLGGLGATMTYGIDMLGGTFSTGMRLPNNTAISARNAANTLDLPMFRLDGIDEIEVMQKMAFDGGISIRLDATTGNNIGTSASEKLGFYGATPVVQPNVQGATGFTSVAGSTVLSGSTFTGGVGTTAYTIGDIINALKKLGLMQS